jgi:hypothetical protein
MLTTRNNPLIFAEFAWGNLVFIEQAASANPSLHPVTMLAMSLFALIVFQHEKNKAQFDKKLRSMKLVGGQSGWPLWNESKPSKTLGALVRNLRHSVAHGGVTFNSTSHEYSKVTVYFFKKSLKTGKILWTGDIRADHLRQFCCKFRKLLTANNPPIAIR